MKPRNKIQRRMAEMVKRRDRPKENLHQGARVRTQSRVALTSPLVRVNEAARRDKHLCFSALLHHVNQATLRQALYRLKRTASPRVNAETVPSYEKDLQNNLKSLCERIHTGRYKPQPVRRVYIPKAGGGLRPLGIPAPEDKIVQSTVARVLSAVYEADFMGFSYGFRSGRAHTMH